MNNILVKQASLAELNELVGLFDGYRQFYGKESDALRIREFLISRFNHGESVIFIAYLNELPVGFTQLYPSFSSVSLARTFILNDLFVVPAARKKSIASHLIESAKLFAITVGAVKLTLSTAVTNEAAQQLYISQGWKKDDQFYAYYLLLQS